VELDLRRALPSGVFEDFPVEKVTETSGDCWARMSQRMLEAEASTHWLMDRLGDTALDLTDTADSTHFHGKPATPQQERSLSLRTRSAIQATQSHGYRVNARYDSADFHMSGALPAHTLCVSLTEGVRGPVMMAFETNACGQLIHVKVQDPSLANWFGLAFALRDQAISDFPICNKSFDLSYCGNDL
jgi:Ni,Fe-hydrogenase III large subunit